MIKSTMLRNAAVGALVTAIGLGAVTAGAEAAPAPVVARGVAAADSAVDESIIRIHDRWDRDRGRDWRRDRRHHRRHWDNHRHYYERPYVVERYRYYEPYYYYPPFLFGGLNFNFSFDDGHRRHHGRHR